MKTDIEVRLTMGLLTLFMAIKLYESQVKGTSKGFSVDHAFTDNLNKALEEHRVNFKLCLANPNDFDDGYSEIVERALLLTGMPVKVFETYDFA